MHRGNPACLPSAPHALFGGLIESGSPSAVFVGYAIGAVLMVGAGIVKAIIGVEAAGRELEDIASPFGGRRRREAGGRDLGGGRLARGAAAEHEARHLHGDEQERQAEDEQTSHRIRLLRVLGLGCTLHRN
jgi:hypothetical protein